MATSIEERLTRLEGKNRRLTIAMLVTGVAAALVVAVGMAGPEAVPEVVRAHKFELLDDNGKVRASLDLLRDQPTLNLLDENGKLRVALSADNGGPSLALSDGNGRTRASLKVTENGSAFALTDENGISRLVLNVDKNGPGGLGLLDKDGKELASLWVNKGRGMPCLVLWDEDGKAQVAMSKGGIVFHDKDSKPRALLGLDNEEEPVFGFSNKEGKPAITMGMRKGLHDRFPEIVVHSPNLSSYTQLNDDGLNLVYSNGPHASFDISENGPKLWFFGTPNFVGPSLQLDLIKSESSLRFSDNNKTTPLRLGLDKKFGPFLMFSDENNRIRQHFDVHGLSKVK
jgi:hypothetical protein